MDALHFLADSAFTFLAYAFLLRLLLQLVRADFRNPLAQAVLALTNWLVLPLRRILPPIGRFDTASLAALLAVQFRATLVLFRMRTGVVFPSSRRSPWKRCAHWRCRPCCSTRSSSPSTRCCPSSRHP